MKENVEIFSYKNGSKIIVESDKTANYIAFAIHVAVGAGDEESSNHGIAHFLEHLFFKSTKQMSTSEIAVYLESLGARINAQTNDVKTVYHFHCLKESFEKCVQMFSKMLLDGLFDEEEINRERDVILEEIARSEDSPIHVAYINAFSTLMDGNRFGHSVLGTPEIIKNISKEEILKFKEKFYTPDKIGFSICGNLSFEEAKQITEKFFSKVLFTEEFEKTENFPIVIKPKSNIIAQSQTRNQTQIYILFKSIKANDALRYSVHLFQDILGGGMSSRLFVELREKRSLAYTTWAECYSCLEFGVLGIYIGTNPSKVEESLKNIKIILKELAEKGVTESELIKAKNNLKSSKVYAQDSKMQVAKLNIAKYYIFNQIPSLEEEFKNIDAVTIEEVNNVAKALFNEKDFVVSIVGSGACEENGKVFLN